MKNTLSIPAWFTLFFVWSAVILWSQGILLLHIIMAKSFLYTFSLAMQTTDSALLPNVLPVVILLSLVFAAGAVMAYATGYIIQTLRAICL